MVGVFFLSLNLTYGVLTVDSSVMFGSSLLSWRLPLPIVVLTNPADSNSSHNN